MADFWRVGSEIVHAARRGIALYHDDCQLLLVAFYRGQDFDFNDTSSHPQVAPCRGVQICDGAPRGRLTWKSAHHADLAIVNAPVILTISGLNAGSRDVYSTLFEPLRAAVFYGQPENLRVLDGAPLDPLGDPLGDPVWRFWPVMDPLVSYANVVSWVAGAATGTCVLIGASSAWPEFRARVEELLPADPNQKAEILALFGAHSLAWWDRLSPQEQRRLTPARALNEEITCNAEKTVWCRWVPTRPGYFKVTGAGSWATLQFLDNRGWLDTGTLDAIESYLDQYRDHPRVRSAHAVFSTAGVDPADLGMDGLPLAIPPPKRVPRPPDAEQYAVDDEWLYTAATGEQHRCPTLDVRVGCGAEALSGVYGETEPIGILVHEMRVATRLPNM